MPHADSQIGKLSISVGVALMTPRAGQSWAELLRDADDALYRAKERGRNMVVVSELQPVACSPIAALSTPP